MWIPCGEDQRLACCNKPTHASSSNNKVSFSRPLFLRIQQCLWENLVHFPPPRTSCPTGQHHERNQSPPRPCTEYPLRPTGAKLVSSSSSFLSPSTTPVSYQTCSETHETHWWSWKSGGDLAYRVWICWSNKVQLAMGPFQGEARVGVKLL